MSSDADPTAQPPEHAALLDAAQALLAPLARLLVAHGIHFATVEERLKAAYINAAREAALQASPSALPHRLVSRISVATGINRREVTRLVQADMQAAPPRRSQALQAFFRWTTDPDYLDSEGAPLTLARQGADGRSFERLAASISRDKHPRSLLDDLIRLRLARWDPEADTVSLERQAFTPDDDIVSMLGYLGSNVGDHLKTAVGNVLGDEPRQFEQALFAHGLSPKSVAAMDAVIRSQWSQLARRLVPELQKMIDADATPEGAPPQPGRLRIGFYAHADIRPVPPADAQENSDAS